MSHGLSTGELVARLSEGLEPVRPVAPLHRQVMSIAAVWAASAAIAIGWLGLHPLGILGRGGISSLLTSMLALVGFAGLTLALASRIPGRERLALSSVGTVALAVLAVMAVGLVLPGSVAEAGTLAQCMDCVGRSVFLAIPSGLMAMSLARRGVHWRPLTAGLGLAIGATSLGALLVHLTCPSPSPWHWLLGHALVPVAAGVPVGLLVATLLDWFGRRSRLAASRELAS